MATDHIAAAVAAMEQMERTAPPTETPAPEASAAEAVADPAVAEQPEAPAAQAPAKADEPPKPADPPKPPDKVAKTWEDIAAEKAALRKEREALGLDSRAKALADAAAKGDAMALLTAAGISWSAAADQVLGKAPVKPEPKPEEQVMSRVEQLERELAASRAEKAEANVMAQIQEKAKDPKFGLVSARKAEKEALNFIKSYFARTGQAPGETLEESIEIALEAVETHLNKEADSWKEVLQKRGGVATSPTKPAVSAAAVSQQATKSLTNQSGAGPSQPGKPSKAKKSESDYYREAAALLTEE